MKYVLRGFFRSKIVCLEYLFYGRKSGEKKKQVVPFFPCVSCAIPHFLAILMTSSDTGTSVPGKCSGKLLLREEAVSYLSCHSPALTLAARASRGSQAQAAKTFGSEAGQTLLK